MRGIIIISVLIIVFLTPISCEDLKIFVDCDKCYTDLSENYSLELQVTLNDENPYIPITLYKGKIDNGMIIDTDTIFDTPYYSIDVKFGEYYSAVAKYRHNGRIIYAVDGRTLSKKLDKSSCDYECYTISGDILDLRLK